VLKAQAYGLHSRCSTRRTGPRKTRLNIRPRRLRSRLSQKASWALGLGRPYVCQIIDYLRSSQHFRPCGNQARHVPHSPDNDGVWRRFGDDLLDARRLERLFAQ